MKWLRTISLRAIDLERLGVDIEFINTDNPERRAEALANAHEIAATRELCEALLQAKGALQEAEKLLHKAWAEHGLRVIDDGDGNAVDVAKAADRMDVAIDVSNAALAKARPTPGEGA